MEADKLSIAVDALNAIASWEEGEEVTIAFNEPGSACIARLALYNMANLAPSAAGSEPRSGEINPSE